MILVTTNIVPHRLATVLLIIACIIRCSLAQSNHSGSGELVRFTLFEGGTTNVVTHLYNNSIVKVSQNSTPNFGLVAFTTGGPITAVLFGYNDIVTFRREKSAPYCLCGNRDIRIDRCSVLGIGTHWVNATIINTQRSHIVTFQIVYDTTSGTTSTKSPNVPLPTVTSSPMRPPKIAPVVQAPIKLPPVTVVAPSASMNVPTPGRTYSLAFTLIYTGNNTIVAQLVNGLVIDVSMYPNSNFNIRVDAINPSIKSVLFLQNNQVEVSKPWAYCGNVGELYNSCPDFNKEGRFNVTVRLYSDANPQSMAIAEESISFTLVGKPSSTPPVDQFPILINTGGPTIIDSENRTWITDSYFVGGNTYSKSQIDLLNTDNDIIYQSERYGNFIYEIPIARASYSVILHFAEILYVLEHHDRIISVLKISSSNTNMLVLMYH